MAHVFRLDIQALRGWAVLIVVLEHIGLGPFHSGYLGVDVFFVISGFVITQGILTQMDEGSFTFRDFYLRRAWRILPAAFVTIGITALLAPLFLGSSEIRDLTWQVVGSLAFNANHVLMTQGGYFDGPADFKPLLHMWSLAIEEQFYLLFPLALVMVRPTWRARMVGMGIAGSMAICSFLLAYEPDVAFYLAPSRAWELLMGAWAALLRPSLMARIQPVSAVAALLALATLPMLPDVWLHPGPAALAVCVATAVILLSNGFSLPRNPLTWIGNVSYSLYLVHWPIIAFANGYYAPTHPPADAKWFFLAASFALACLLHYSVEKPFRRLRWPVRSTAGAMAVCCAALIAVQATQQFRLNDIVDRSPNRGLADTCHKDTSLWQAECRTGPMPEVMVWGDSYAMHLVPGIKANTDKGILQATFSSCGPTPGLAQNRKSKFGPSKAADWRDRCFAFNDEAMEVFKETSSVKVVVLASLFRYYFNGSPMFRRDKDGSVSENVLPETVVDALTQVIDEVRSRGATPIVVGPTPRKVDNEDMGLCAERLVSGRLMHSRSDCTIPKAEAEHKVRLELEMLRELSRRTGAEVVNLYDILCGGPTCITVFDGKNLYQDAGHLSRFGSEYVVSRSPALLKAIRLE